MHRLVVVVGLMLLFLRFNATPAFACSAGELPPTPVEELITRSVFVRATVIESSANNHMLAVDRYLVGSGPRILFLNRESPADWALYTVRNYDTGCHFGGDVASLGTTAYFALDREVTGTYRFRTGAPGLYEDFITLWDDTVNFWTVIDPAGDPEDFDNYESHSLTEPEFIAFVEEMTGQESSPPVGFAPTPRRKLLYITTESGQRYMLPVDGGAVVPVAAPLCGENCPILSPDGTHIAQILDEDTLQFSYPGALVGDREDEQREIIVGGQAVLFAPNSDLALVWDNDQLNAYRFLMDIERYGMNGARMNAEQIWSTELTTNDSVSGDMLRGKAVWSEGSTAFAYVDAAGIWRYDFFQQTEPQLVVPFAEVTPVLDVFELSRTGRYLRYGAVNDWTLLNVETGSAYDNGLISPEERYLALFESSEIRASISAREDMAGCYVPVRPECALSITIEDEFELTYSAWVDSNTVLVFYCLVDDQSRCDVEQIDVSQPYDMQLPRNPEWRPRDFFPAYDVAYDMQYGTLALVSGDYTIQFDRYILFPNRVNETPDLSYVLDSPIVDIEWGESLWYDDGR